MENPFNADFSDKTVKNKTIILQKYRTALAYLMSTWFMMLVISGTIFTHKEVTSTGEIVIHNHPYDFTKKGESHHESDAEIHFLDIVFCGTYTPSEFVNYNLEPKQVFHKEYHIHYIDSFFISERPVWHLRGPPTFC